jgi:ProP effector
MSKTKKRASVAAVLALLTSTFPKTFAVDPKWRKPLKIGIADDLIVRIDGAIQRRELGVALMVYCNSVSYLRACKVGAERFDLDGNAVGIVTAAEAAHAIGKLTELQAKTKKTAATATPQPPLKKLSLADLKIAARMRKEAAS